MTPGLGVPIAGTGVEGCIGVWLDDVAVDAGVGTGDATVDGRGGTPVDNALGAITPFDMTGL